MLRVLYAFLLFQKRRTRRYDLMLQSRPVPGHVFMATNTTVIETRHKRALRRSH